MKSTVQDHTAKSCDNIPRLMREARFPDVIVLLYHENDDETFEGIVVAGESRPVGYTYARWGIYTLEPFHGTVTLEQE